MTPSSPSSRGFRSRHRQFSTLWIERLEDRAVPATVSLHVPAPTSDAWVPLSVATTLAQPVQIDVDLNHDGKFQGAGELDYASGHATVGIYGLVPGTYGVRARVVNEAGQRFVSAVQSLQILPPSALKLPVIFEPNVGQSDAPVLFLGRAQNQTVYISATETTLVSTSGTTSEVQRFRLVGANPDAVTSAESLLPGVSNYLKGNDASKWQTDIANYGRVVSHDVYAGIDLVYHSSQNRLEYDFRVAAGADPSVIALEFPDAVGLTIAADGSLLIHQADGSDLRKSAPLMYQEVGGRTVAVKGDWILKGPNQAGYTITAYDATRELVIDPIVFSTLIDFSGNDTVTAGVSDAAGNMYLVGGTTSTDFVTQGPYQGTLAGGSDLVITKINAAGTAVLYSTYLGGSNNDAGETGIAVNSAGEVAVTSRTDSIDFPLLNAFQSAIVFFNDNFVTKLNAAGNGLIFSTYLGGGGFESGNSIAFDSTGAVYASGNTTSGDFPTSAGAYQTTYGGGGLNGDAYVTKFDATGTMVYSTYVGGSSDDWGQAIEVIGTNAVIAGKTQSNDFPTSPGALQTSLNGGQDIYVTQLNSTGTALVYSTYLGGSANDGGGTFAPLKTGLEVDAAGNVYIGSTSSSTDFPTTAGVFQSASAGGEDGVVFQLNPTGTGLVFSTYLGGSGNDPIYDLARDAAGNIYVTGESSSSNFPLLNYFQSYIGPFSNIQIVELNPSLSSLVFSSMLGNGFVSGRAIGLDGLGNVWVAGPGNASFPTVNPLFTTATGNAGFVAKVAPTLANATFVESGGTTTLTEGGATDTYTVTLTVLPTANVLLTLSGGTQVATSATVLTFTTANWNVAQTVTVTAVNDFIAEGTHNGIITTTASSTDLRYNGATIASLTAQITDDDTAGLTLVPTGGSTDVAEGGTTDTVTIVLTSQPTAAVNVTLNPGTQVTVSTSVLTFTALNWNVAQTVTVTAIDDVVAEGSHSGLVTPAASSLDTMYSGWSGTAVTATITDNDTAGVTITPTLGSTDVAEGGATDTYRIVLNTQPTANVVITLNTGVFLTASPGVVTFTSANWNLPQTITVIAVNDTFYQGTHLASITHSATSSDTFYSGISIANLDVNITDNEPPPSLGVVEPAGGLTALEGFTTTFTAFLQTPPTASVVITLNPDSQVSVSSTSLTFTTLNWNTPQTVTVTAVDDTRNEGDHVGLVNFTASSADLTYNGLAIAPITTHIIDNEGTLALGTDKADKLLVNFIAGKVQVILNNKSSYLAGPITQLVVRPGEGNDYVQITNPTVPVIVLGGGGTDTIFVVGSGAYNNFFLDSSAVTVNGRSVSMWDVESLILGGRTANDTFTIVNAPAIPTEFKGDRGNDTVYATDADNAWNITGNAIGTLNSTITINGIENLIGGAGDDTFTLGVGKTIGGKVDGGGGTNTLDYSAYITATTVNLQTGVATGIKQLLNVQSLRGGQAFDKLIAANESNVWTLSGTDAGDVNGILFEDYENLTGGTLDDNFNLPDGVGVRGKIDGGLGSDILDYSGYSGPVAVNLQAKTATNTGGFISLEQFLGGAGTDSFTGSNLANKWLLDDIGGGTLNRTTLFAGFENFTGGSSTDLFTLDGLGDWLGILNGSAGKDSLVAFPGNINLWTSTGPYSGALNGHAFLGIETRK